MPGDSKLRPYYDHDTFNAGYSVIYKPGIGLIDTNTQKEITTTFNYGSGGSRPNLLSGNLGLGGSGGLRASTAQRPDRIAPSTDINYINDLELSEYLDYNNLSELFKNLVWSFFKNYCRVLLSQPLDIARLALQVGFFKYPSTQSSHASKGDDESLSKGRVIESMDDSLYDDEEIDFFQPASTQKGNKIYSKPQDFDFKIQSRHPRKNPHKIHPVSQHTVDIMSAIASKDGPLALFRGANASFIHYTLSHTIEAWITGFISPFLNIPDPFFLDLTHSTEPAKSLWLSVVACVLTGIVLMPLDLIKVRLMITSSDSDSATRENVNEGPKHNSLTRESSPMSDSDANPCDEKTTTRVINQRSVRDSLRFYPTRLLLNPPPSITVLTILHQISTIVFRKSAPYFLFVRYNIDYYSSPNIFTLANLGLSITEFFIKLPVENLLRKEQVKFLLKPKTRDEDKHRVVTIDNPDKTMIVDYNAWDSHHSVAREGSGKDKNISVWTRIKLLGLFKGWRVGVLNVIGFWGYNIVKSTSTIAEERL